MRAFVATIIGLVLLLTRPASLLAGEDKEKKDRPDRSLEEILETMGGPGAGVAAGAKKEKEKGRKDEAGAGKGAAAEGRGIAEAEIAIIKDYIAERRASGQGLPPGLAKREELPPGLQRHLEREGRLPPGLEMQRLPGDLLARLPKRVGEEYVVVGDDVVLIEKRTEIVLDVLKDILAGQ